MINNLNPIINNLNNNKENNTENIKNKNKSKINKNTFKNENKEQFSVLFNDFIIENLIQEFIDYEPEVLIKDIINKGNEFLKSRNEKDLEEYKYLLGGFLAITINKSYKVNIIKEKKKFNDISEKYFIIIKNINEKYLALLESFISSQGQIFKIIKEIEGLLLNIKI